MRKVIFAIAVSLDGFIDSPDGNKDWIVGQNEFADSNAFISRFDTAFYGRIAYEKLGLPRRCNACASNEERAYVDSINSLRKYVFSRKLKHVAGNGMMINGNLVSEVGRLKDEEGKDIWLCGGADILKTFIDLDFVDEYMFFVQPVVLGSGKRLFIDLQRKLRLSLTRATYLKSGVVMLQYQPENRIPKRQDHDRSFQNKR